MKDVYTLPTTKKCSRCGEFLPAGAYTTLHRTLKDGTRRPYLQSQCNECRKSTQKKWKRSTGRAKSSLNLVPISGLHKQQALDLYLACGRSYANISAAGFPGSSLHHILYGLTKKIRVEQAERLARVSTEVTGQIDNLQDLREAYEDEHEHRLLFAKKKKFAESFEDSKPCYSCLKIFTHEDFYEKTNSRGVRYKSNVCKYCDRERQKQIRKSKGQKSERPLLTEHQTAFVKECARELRTYYKSARAMSLDIGLAHTAISKLLGTQAHIVSRETANKVIHGLSRKRKESRSGR